MHYLALLRGINVGGNNIIKMADLRACFEQMGFENVATYIQTGNVLFDHSRTALKTLEQQIAARLATEFDYHLPTLVLTKNQLQQVVDDAPGNSGGDDYRCDVIYTIAPLTPAQVVSKMPLREGVDTIAAGRRAVYFSRLKEKATKSKLSEITKMPLYKNVTIRNWNTTRTLWEKMNAL